MLNTRARAADDIDVPAPTQPLVDSERVRVPFMLAHILAYTGGVAMFVGTLDGFMSVASMLVMGYLAIAVLALVALFTRSAPLGAFLIADAITVPLIPLLTGQHPASVHVTMLVLVLAAASMARYRVVVFIGVIEVLGFAAGVATQGAEPLAAMPAAQIERSELGGMVIGAAVGVIAIIVLASLLRTSLATQAAALAAQQRTNALQQRFVSMVSHELRTPLTSIRGFAEVLTTDRDALTDLERAEFTEAIAQQSVHLSRLVDDVLVVVRIDAARLSVEREPVDLAGTIYAAQSMIAVPESKRVETGSVTTLPVLADRDRLVQVVRNLIENGMKYGGDLVRVHAASAGTSVRLVVEDDGPGIPENLVEDVFDEFVQVGRPAERAASGFGLGLPIARRLVQAMDGRIWAERSELGGASFVVDLPVAGAGVDRVSDATSPPV